MLIAALMGGQVSAEITGTSIAGYDLAASDSSHYYGKYSIDESVTLGNVIITTNVYGEVPNDAEVYGGWSYSGNATGNTVTMSAYLS